MDIEDGLYWVPVGIDSTDNFVYIPKESSNFRYVLAEIRNDLIKIVYPTYDCFTSKRFYVDRFPEELLLKFKKIEDYYNAD